MIEVINQNTKKLKIYGFLEHLPTLREILGYNGNKSGLYDYISHNKIISD